MGLIDRWGQSATDFIDRWSLNTGDWIKSRPWSAWAKQGFVFAAIVCAFGWLVNAATPTVIAAAKHDASDEKNEPTLKEIVGQDCFVGFLVLYRSQEGGSGRNSSSSHLPPRSVVPAHVFVGDFTPAAIIGASTIACARQKPGILGVR